MSGSFSQLPGRAKFAAAGAGLAVQNRFASERSAGKVANTLFLALMLLALTIAITAIVAILAWAFVEGRTRLDADLIFNGPSTVRRATAGYSVAILGTLQIIGGVIALIVPLGVRLVTLTTWRAFLLGLRSVVRTLRLCRVSGSIRSAHALVLRVEIICG